MLNEITQEKQYWGSHHGDEGPYVHYNEAEYRFIIDLFGKDNFDGKTILEMGCGMGVWTANLSRLGAWVYHFDLSPVVVRKANQFAASDKVRGFCADMNFLPFQSNYFDFVFGSMVLHHTSHHDDLGRELYRILRPGGKAIFHENSSRNPILMLARGKLVGRWGIPKNSSPGEYPLRPKDVVKIGKAFDATQIYYIRMYFFQMAVKYLLKRESGNLYELSKRIDGWMYRWLPLCRPLSYYQILEFKKSG